MPSARDWGSRESDLVSYTNNIIHLFAAHLFVLAGNARWECHQVDTTTEEFCFFSLALKPKEEGSRRGKVLMQKRVAVGGGEG